MISAAVFIFVVFYGGDDCRAVVKCGGCVDDVTVIALHNSVSSSVDNAAELRCTSICMLSSLLAVRPTISSPLTFAILVVARPWKI